MKNTRIALLALGLTFIVPACGGSSVGGPSDAGVSATAGRAATGGTSLSSGGAPGTGGRSGTGGAATGGATTLPTDAGNIATGGTSASTGGSSATGAGGDSPAGAAGSAGSTGSATGGAAAGRGGNSGRGGGAGQTGTVGAGGRGGDSGAGASAGGGGGQGGNTVAPRSSGCGKAFTRPNAASRINIAVGGAMRTYQLFVPPTYAAETAYPFVITFHGGDGSSASSRAEMNLESSPRGIVAYLNYVNDAWSYAAGSPDIAYYEALVAEVSGNFCVDTNRILVTGFSLGAIQTNGIGCTKGGKTVRAIVPIDGSGPYPQPAPPSEASLACPAGTPVGDPAVMIIHGSNDTTALYQYGQWSANYWRKANGCGATSMNLASPFQNCVAYPGCRAPVYFCTHSGNHMVPSSAGGWVWAFIDLLK